jgi:5-(carboxyamino)imidazole ribonucleotide mutase
MKENCTKIAIIMGSDSDFPVLKKCITLLKSFQVEYEIMICSAHRTPDRAREFARDAENNGFGVIIAAAGKAAHLAGVLSSYTVLPVIGIPIKSSTMDGLDSLLSTVQMPSGVPVATVAIDGAVNAALLAIQILSVANLNLREKLKEYKKEMLLEVKGKNELLKEKLLKEGF